MVTHVQNPSAIEQNAKNKVVAHPSAGSYAVEDTHKLRLTSILQTTLELDLIVRLFYEYVAQCISLDGLSYSHDAKGLAITVGKTARHRCNYRLSTNSSVYGEITLYRGRRFSETEMAAIESFLGSLLYPLRNAISYRDAVLSAATDPLTGLGNRAALEHALSHEMSMASRYQQPLSIMIADIDYFKSINDRFGHSVGDKVLCSVGQAMADTCRKSDAVFRYGGEEFVIIFSKTDLEGARIIAERVRNQISSLDLKHLEDGENVFKLSVSISGGVANMLPAEDADNLLKRADKALYEAKREGRNRIITA